MKLSDYISYLNLLEQPDYTPEYGQAVRQLQSLSMSVARAHVQLDSFTSDMEFNVSAVINAFDNVQATLDALKARLRELIAEKEPKQYKASTVLYEQGMLNESPEYIFDRKLGIDDQSNILLRSRLRNYSDWRLPGMIIRPGPETFIEDLVPLDPLYLVDQHQALLDPAILAFTLEYQRRLRPYVIDDRRDGMPLWQLPSEQFGMIFAYNYFNYRPIEVIKRYLADVYSKLRPGGVFIFTFNDCDRGHGAALSEKFFMCYTPGHAVAAAAEREGYEIMNLHHGHGDLSWFELKKPGSIQSIRGGQSLAKIVAPQ